MQLQSPKPDPLPNIADEALAFIRDQSDSEAALHANLPARPDNIAPSRFAQRGEVAQAFADKLAEHGITRDMSSEQAKLKIKAVPDSARTEAELAVQVDAFLEKFPRRALDLASTVEQHIALGTAPTLATGVRFRISAFEYAKYDRSFGDMFLKAALYPVYFTFRHLANGRKATLAEPNFLSVKSAAIARLKSEVEAQGLSLIFKTADDTNAYAIVSFKNVMPK